MIDNKYIDLMNKEIDNVITNEEKNQLQKYLDSNEPAKEYFNELLLTNNYLNELPDKDPSENLKKRIINSINFNKYSTKNKSKISWSYIFNPKLKFIYAFAIGLFAGLIIYGVISNYTSNFDTADTYGTIGLENKNATVIEKIPILVSNISGEIEVTNREDKFWLNVRLNSSKNYDLTVTYPDNIKFENINPKLGSSFDCTIDKNLIKTSSSGLQQYRLLFSQYKLSSAELNLKITQSGEIIYNHNLTLER